MSDSAPLKRHADSIVLGNTLVSTVEPPIRQPVILHDETLRDGEQTIGVAFSRSQKLTIAKRLLEAGVGSINVGFPAVSTEERETVTEIARTIDPAVLSCLARANQSDIESVRGCGVPTVALFVGISDVHLERKYRMTVDQAYTTMARG